MCQIISSKLNINQASGQHYASNSILLNSSFSKSDLILISMQDQHLPTASILAFSATSRKLLLLESEIYKICSGWLTAKNLLT